MKSVLKLMIIVFILSIFSILLFKNILAEDPPVSSEISSSEVSSSESSVANTSSEVVSSSAPVVTSTPTPASNNADVLSIICKEGVFTPLFNPLVKIGYIVNVPDSVTQANFTVKTANNKALVSIVGYRALTMGDNKVTITITAEDKKTKNIYEINVIRGAKIESSSAVSSVFSSMIVQNESRLANNVEKSLLSSLQGLKEENQKLKEANSAISEKFAVITILLVVLIAILIFSLAFVIVKFREN